MYEGDVKLYNTDAGGDIVYTNGQPVMDGGLETAAFISVFTKEEWWGNEFAIKESEKIGSRFLDLQNESLTSKTVRDAEEAVKDSLEWMLDTGLASNIDVQAFIPQQSRLDVQIKIFRPELAETFEFSANWESQLKYGG